MNKKYENLRLIAEINIKMDDLTLKGLVRSQVLDGYEEHKAKLWEKEPYKSIVGNYGPAEFYEETEKLNKTLSENEIKQLAEEDFKEFHFLFEREETLKIPVYESMKKDPDFFNHVQKKHPEIFSEYAHKFYKEWEPKLKDCIRNRGPLPKEYQSNKEAIMTYQFWANTFNNHRVYYSTFAQKEQIETMVKHANQLLENLEKPAINHEQQSESSHEMEF